MRRSLVLLFLSFIMGYPPMAAGQYMFLDTNGDGVNTAADVLQPNGTPSTVDIWLRTNADRDGSPARCNTEIGPSLDIISCVVNLEAAGGTVSYSGYINRQSSWTVHFGELNPDGIHYRNGFGGFPFQPPGLYHIATLTITGQTGTPVIRIVDYVPGGAFDATSFGTTCVGSFFDNTYRLDGPNVQAQLGVGDWFDADGTAGSGLDNDAPVLSPIPDPVGFVAVPMTFTATASDPDVPAQALTFSLGGFFPPGGAAIDATSGAFTWTPDVIGSFPVTIVVKDDGSPVRADAVTFYATILRAAPTADAGGPYAGVAGVPLSFDGTGSSHPEGVALSYQWDFGDGTPATGATPVHTYSIGDVYQVILTVTAPAAGTSARDTTTAAILADLDVSVFVTGGNKTIRLGSGKPETCVQMEPVGGAFDITEIDPGSVRMTYGGASIQAISGKSVVGSDKNQNGVEELTCCFSKESLRSLFASLPGGEQTVDVLIEAAHVSGGSIQGALAIRVIQGGGPLLAIAPNPLNPFATATFHTSRLGAVSVRLYDLQGRLVRTLMDEPSLAAGYHDVTIDGQDANLASGVYYVKVRSADGEVSKAVTILK
jgi:PKD domain/Secretion system C-terminal sorting domain